jgi:hypothetical protein
MNRPEQDLQRACVQLLHVYEGMGKLAFAHVPNGGKRGKVEAAIMKGLGVRAGFPDFILIWSTALGDPCSGFIELKSENGCLSYNQTKWRDTLKRHNHAWAEVRSIDQLQKVLAKWGIVP